MDMLCNFYNQYGPNNVLKIMQNPSVSIIKGKSTIISIIEGQNEENGINRVLVTLWVTNGGKHSTSGL